ncbi:hypothetical protein D5R81_02100 [Parashewanella spongiae]|uniref:Uncharacterized protein n=1 Tax=Parashewanella spongiae TaxID=342950 RepID=A0A3A6TXG2_9GAMM|nr:hypothetical protein D5R81_02100 [Parashewanella spongiae]
MNLFQAALLVIPTMILNLVIATVPAYFLWNWIVPSLFSLPNIGFFQMLGLIVLVKCIFNEGYFKINTAE